MQVLQISQRSAELQEARGRMREVVRMMRRRGHMRRVDSVSHGETFSFLEKRRKCDGCRNPNCFCRSPFKLTFKVVQPSVWPSDVNVRANQALLASLTRN